MVRITDSQIFVDFVVQYTLEMNLKCRQLNAVSSAYCIMLSIYIFVIHHFAMYRVDRQ